MIELFEDERLDYLLAEELRIIQSPSVFAFSLDAVLLARFANIPIQKGKIVDLCSGNAVVPLLLSNKTKAEITGVEIQDRLYGMAVRSIRYNGLEDRLHMIRGDVKNITETLGNAQFDAVTCNPPYFTSPSPKLINENRHLAIARHEILCTLEDVVAASGKLLRQGGKAAFVHRPERLLDLLFLMRQYRLEPKRLRFVYPKAGKEANTILVEGIKDGKPGLKTLSPLFVYDAEDQYTAEVREILYGNEE